MKLQIAGYNLALFVACMVCHGELYQLKPSPRHLTAYFLLISAGGALGGVLVALVAPAVFTEYREFHLGLVALAAIFTVVCFRHRSRALAFGATIGAILTVFAIPGLEATFDGSSGYYGELKDFVKDYKWWIAGGVAAFASCAINLRTRRLIEEWRFPLGAFVVLIAGTLSYAVAAEMRAKEATPVIRASRNFYGTLKVFDYSRETPEDQYYLLMHGATTHGLQFVNNDKTFKPPSYYGPASGIGLTFAHLPDKPRRFGIVGLGTGSLTTYGRAGDYVRVYEINPAVEALARDPFTYLAKCPAKLDLVMGDARLELEHELARNASQQFDVLALDAFSSDAIPVHLLTKEAFAVYLKHLKPDGVIAVHISNRYLELQPVVERLAAEFGLSTACISDDFTEACWFYDTTWMLVTKNKAFLAQPDVYAATAEPKANAPKAALWTDDSANLYSIMK
jgi:SAM-dependent methyltransferase